MLGSVAYVEKLHVYKIKLYVGHLKRLQQWSLLSRIDFITLLYFVFGAEFGKVISRNKEKNKVNIFTNFCEGYVFLAWHLWSISQFSTGDNHLVRVRCGCL